MKSSSSTGIQVVRGVGDVRKLISSLYDPNLEKPECAYGISNMDMLENFFPEFTVSSGNAARLEAGVPSRAIYTSSRGKVYSRSDRVLRRESRFVPPELLEPVGDITIVRDTVVFISAEGGEVTACAVTNPATARQMVGLFEILWTLGR